MRSELQDIASVQMGYSFRTRLETLGPGSVGVIQMKDLVSENLVDVGGLVRVDIDKLKEHHLAEQGDLVFRSRGLVNTSAILADDPGLAVVAAPLFRIRVTTVGVMPGYLNWFINQAPAQAFLASHAKGTASKMISKHAVEKLDVFIPSVEQQKRVVDLAAWAEKEQKLMEALADKRGQYIAKVLEQLATGG